MSSEIRGWKKINRDVLPVATITGMHYGANKVFKIPVLTAKTCAAICFELIKLNIAYPAFFHLLYDQHRSTLIKCIALATGIPDNEKADFEKIFTKDELSHIWDIVLTQMRPVYDEDYRTETYTLGVMEAMAIHQIGQILNIGL